jgi:hypothetical protein
VQTIFVFIDREVNYFLSRIFGFMKITHGCS